MKYPYSVALVQDGYDQYWVAKSNCLSGCIGQGESANDAVKELEENEIAWLETAVEIGMAIPEIPVEVENPYSGKVALRMAPSVHKKAVMVAKREGISLNQFINDAITTYTAEIETANYISKEVVRSATLIGTTFLSGMTMSQSTSQRFTIPMEESKTHYSFSASKC